MPGCSLRISRAKASMVRPRSRKSDTSPSMRASRAARLISAGGGESTASSACNGVGPGESVRISQTWLSAPRRSAGTRPARTTDDLPSRMRHDGDEAAAAHLFDQRRHEGFATDEEGGVLLAEGKEAAIGTDRSARIGGERRLVARRQAACGPRQDLDGHPVFEALPQIDPSVEARNPSAGSSAPGSSTGITGKPGSCA